jgi:transcriptional regulator with XRE-family HTH domain
MTKEQLRIRMGENIRNERVSRNMSIDDLAEMLELTPGFVGLIERGKRGATPHTLFKLSDILGIPIDPLFFRAEGGLSFGEEAINATKVMRGKITSLISNLTEKELQFVIDMVKGVKEMNHTFTEGMDDDDSDE